MNYPANTLDAASLRIFSVFSFQAFALITVASATLCIVSNMITIASDKAIVTAHSTLPI